jgi:predicted lipoprotein
MRYWSILHTHRHGSGTTVLASEVEPDYDLIERWAVSVLDYEPDREDEYLEVEETEIITVEMMMNDLIFEVNGDGELDLAEESAEKSGVLASSAKQEEEEN